MYLLGGTALLGLVCPGIILQDGNGQNATAECNQWRQCVGKDEEWRTGELNSGMSHTQDLRLQWSFLYHTVSLLNYTDTGSYDLPNQDASCSYYLQSLAFLQCLASCK